MSNKKWVTPKLIILIRKTEENILTGCKTLSDEGGGPQDAIGICLYQGP